MHASRLVGYLRVSLIPTTPLRLAMKRPEGEDDGANHARP
jgi:hypothetical protein